MSVPTVKPGKRRMPLDIGREMADTTSRIYSPQDLPQGLLRGYLFLAVCGGKGATHANRTLRERELLRSLMARTFSMRSRRRSATRGRTMIPLN